ncbi:hypothetical protein SAMN04488118_1157 [Epibacterium ulvae]|uniref:Uncharacterized protein n=1 Tax=Epibacterium ulvae TaxID=1156985 RepID=A0A1G5RF31_9RHOB|nr:hypothetical protein SAMN04488118_1157 [Epibacterium ulvae]
MIGRGRGACQVPRAFRCGEPTARERMPRLMYRGKTFSVTRHVDPIFEPKAQLQRHPGRDLQPSQHRRRCGDASGNGLITMGAILRVKKHPGLNRLPELRVAQGLQPVFNGLDIFKHALIIPRPAHALQIWSVLS